MIQNLLTALQRIAGWEMPPTGQIWNDVQGAARDERPVSYRALHGTDGEQEVIMGYARQALADWHEANKVFQSTPPDELFVATKANDLIDAFEKDGGDKAHGSEDWIIAVAEHGQASLDLLPKLVARIDTLQAANTALHNGIKFAERELFEAADKFNVIGLNHPGHTATREDSLMARHRQQDKEACMSLTERMSVASAYVHDVIKAVGMIHAYGVPPKRKEIHEGD